MTSGYYTSIKSREKSDFENMRNNFVLKKCLFYNKNTPVILGKEDGFEEQNKIKGVKFLNCCKSKPIRKATRK